jgi:hypothetical protein
VDLASRGTDLFVRFRIENDDRVVAVFEHRPEPVPRSHQFLFVFA